MSEAASDAIRHEVVRRGRVSWLTNPPGGVARIGVESQAFGALRPRCPKATPSLTLRRPASCWAITHAMFMAGVLSEALEAAGSPAKEIVVEASCTISGRSPGRKLVAVDLQVQARVLGLDATRFDELAAAARQQALRAAGARDDIAGRLQAGLA